MISQVSPAFSSIKLNNNRTGNRNISSGSLYEGLNVAGSLKSDIVAFTSDNNVSKNPPLKQSKETLLAVLKKNLKSDTFKDIKVINNSAIKEQYDVQYNSKTGVLTVNAARLKTKGDLVELIKKANEILVRGESVLIPQKKEKVTKQELVKVLPALIRKKISNVYDLKEVKVINKPKWEDRFTYRYDLQSNILTINAAKINTNKELKEAINNSRKLIHSAKLLKSAIEKLSYIYKDDYAIEKEFMPKVSLIHAASETFRGGYLSNFNEIVLNIPNIIKEKPIETRLALTLSHELSHCRNYFEFSLIDPADIPKKYKSDRKQTNLINVLQDSKHFVAYREYRKTHNPLEKNSSEYSRTFFNYLMLLKDNVDTKYYNQLEEASARTSSALSIIKARDKGFLKGKYMDPQMIGEVVLDLRDIALKRDPDVKKLIKSGKIQLDEKSLAYITDNKDKFKLDLSKQRGGKK